MWGWVPGTAQQWGPRLGISGLSMDQGRGRGEATASAIRGSLTVSQRQRRGLAPHVPQGEHGAVPIEQRARLIQQGLPELGDVLLLIRGSRVHRQVGASAGCFLVLLQPFEPLDGQLAGLGYLQQNGTETPSLGSPVESSPTSQAGAPTGQSMGLAVLAPVPALLPTHWDTTDKSHPPLRLSFPIGTTGLVPSSVKPHPKGVMERPMVRHAALTFHFHGVRLSSEVYKGRNCFCVG